MAGRVRVVMNSPGVVEFLQGPAVEQIVRQQAEQIAARAGAGFEADTFTGHDRAHGIVRATTRDAYRAELKDKALTRAAGGSSA